MTPGAHLWCVHYGISGLSRLYQTREACEALVADVPEHLRRIAQFVTVEVKSVEPVTAAFEFPEGRRSECEEPCADTLRPPAADPFGVVAGRAEMQTLDEDAVRDARLTELRRLDDDAWKFAEDPNSADQGGGS